MAAAPQLQNIGEAQDPAVVQTVNSGQAQPELVGQHPNATTTAKNHPRQKYLKILRVLGITECIIGLLLILLAVIANSIVSREVVSYRTQRRNPFKPYNQFDSYDSYSNYGYGSYYTYSSMQFTYVSQGIWCGLFILMTGVLGILVTNYPLRRMYIINMTLAIIAACIAFSGCVLSGLAASFSVFSASMVALHSIITILISVTVIITITHAIFCCSGVCYSSKSVSTLQAVYFPQQNMAQPQPQYVQGPNGQLMMVVSQPTMPQIMPQLPQTPAFQQAPITVSAAVTQMPSPSVQQPQGIYENLPARAAPPYNL